MSVAEVISQEESLEILRRLISALQTADHIVSEEKAENQIYAVTGAADSMPSVSLYADIPALCKHINELRAVQLAHPEQRYYVHIFCGRRWTIQKGRTWQLFDGKQLIPIDAADLPPVVDDSGSLLERIDLDSVLPGNVEEEVVEEASPVQVRPPTVGYDDEGDFDSAPPGRDPEIV